MPVILKSIKTTPRFEKKFNHLPPKLQKLVIKRKEIFAKNPFDKRLKTHKLRGPLKGFWSFSVTYRYRVLFNFLNKNKVFFYDIGTHEIYR